MTASIDEQIARKRAAADKQAARAAALKKELRDLEKKKAAAERKARTHRLVEVGAILEQTSGMTFDTEDSRRALSVALTEQLRYTDGTPFTRGGQIAEARRPCCWGIRNERHHHFCKQGRELLHPRRWLGRR